MTDSILIALLTCAIVFMTTLRADELAKINFYQGHAYSSSLQSSRNLETNSLPFSFLHSTASVPVKLGEAYHEKNKPLLQLYPTMIISISSNESGLFGGFMDTSYSHGFSCQSSYCIEDDVSREYISSWIMGTANSITINTTLSIAEGAWQLQVPALYFSETPSIIANYAYSDIGWIGLGTGLGADKNFQNKNPVFSILSNPLSGPGSLIFGFNSSLADMSKRPQIMTSDLSWRMTLSSISVRNSIAFSVDSSHLGPISVEFDLAVRDISFPPSIVDSIFNELEKQYRHCKGRTCISYDFKGLPPIILTFSDGAQLTIGPEIYMIQNKNQDGSFFYHPISFVAKSISKYGANRIVLGKHILDHFYSVFQCIDGANTISLYSLASNTTRQEDRQSTAEPILPDSSTSGTHTEGITFIVIIFCVLLVFSGLGVLGAKNSWSRKRIGWSHIDLELPEQERDDQSVVT